jgi:hypothetical protein
MATVLVTACTARKATANSPVVSLRSVAKGNVSSVAKAWIKRFSAAAATAHAGKLYAGPGPTLARSLQAKGLEWHIVSAGAGLVSATQPIPAYDLTISGLGASSVRSKIDNASKEFAAEWWSAICAELGEPTPLHRLVARPENELVLLALTQPYLGMVEAELRVLSVDAIRRIRLIGPRELKRVPDALQSVWMPYDASLNGADSPVQGPESSFTYRAAWHFLQRIFPKRLNGSPDEHKEMVSAALSKWRKPTRTNGQRMNDAELIEMIDELSEQGLNSPTAMLRRLREQGIGCEQFRFTQLYEAARG